MATFLRRIPTRILCWKPVVRFVLIAGIVLCTVFVILQNDSITKSKSNDVSAWSINNGRNNISFAPIFDPVTTPNGLQNSSFLLVIIVSSSPTNSAKRNGIRKTWGKVGNWKLYGREPEVFRRHTYKTVFVIANSLSRNISQKIQKEIALNHDILLGNFTDSYKSLLLKDFMAFKWVLSIDCKYILKADDDVYVNVPLMVGWLGNKYSRIPKELYSGFVHWWKAPKRSSESKHFLSSKLYGNDVFPPYCAGASYLVSHDLVSRVLDASRVIRPFEIEDVYIGILVYHLGVKPLEHEGFRLRLQIINSKELDSFTECFFLNTFAYGHRLEAKEMIHLHGIFRRISFQGNANVVYHCLSLDLAFIMSRAVPFLLFSILGIAICGGILRRIVLKTTSFLT